MNTHPPQDAPYCYPYPRPMVTVDIVLLHKLSDGIKVLLIQRKNPPFQGQWAFPGGFVDMDEPLETAAKRELEEETSLSNIPLKQFHTYGDPGRDPRGRSITVVYLAIMEGPVLAKAVAADDAHAASWFRVDALPKLAFDHEIILQDILKSR